MFFDFWVAEFWLLRVKFRFYRQFSINSMPQDNFFHDFNAWRDQFQKREFASCKSRDSHLILTTFWPFLSRRFVWTNYFICKSYTFLKEIAHWIRIWGYLHQFMTSKPPKIAKNLRKPKFLEIEFSTTLIKRAYCSIKK